MSALADPTTTKGALSVMMMMMMMMNDDPHQTNPRGEERRGEVGGGFFFSGGWFCSTADEIQNQVVMGMQAKGERESLRVEERKKRNKEWVALFLCSTWDGEALKSYYDRFPMD